MTQRQITEVRTAHPSRDGDGIAIQRISGMRHAGMDPILMIDELRSEQREDFAGGFPPHPHRGMQTLTYLKRGGISHEDSLGNRGEIRGGGAQWMSAGRGVIHSEMPTVDTNGLHGFQLWVNLPAARKMSAPNYRDVPANELVEWRGEGTSATAIAGQWHLADADVTGPLAELAGHAGVLDMSLDPEVELTLQVPDEENLLAYVYAGSMIVNAREVHAQQMAVTSAGRVMTLHAGVEGTQVLLLRGAPLGEPVANYGPFVMNTPDEIEQTLRDYQSGQFP
ncbi:nuclease PIN [Halioglobus sp. HI00S01]|uniref:pirin family protein n=1 Tax=Halioglobus sp. HI00S01 TaxID=1822214 RepID=UPI0007C2152C|nr:pirin family protein [Halioglobus sp. HI00S01]KZX57058.1 nuclease PIN [Halioglobus sp. HI00S01]